MCLATVLQEVISTPLHYVWIPEHVVSAWHVQIFFGCKDPARFPLVFLASFLSIAVLTLTLLALAVLAIVLSTAAFTGVVEPGRY